MLPGSSIVYWSGLENRSQVSRIDRPLRVGVDLTALLPAATGVDTYLQRLALTLSEVDRDTRYTVFVNREDRGLFSGRLGQNFELAGWCLRPRMVRLLFQQFLLPAAAVLGRLDVVHSPSFIMPLIRAGRRHLLTVYDMTFFSHPECHIPLRRSRPFRAAILASLKRADLITVPSRSTRDEILRFAPGVAASKIRLVVPGISEEFRPVAPDASATAAGQLGIRGPYLLYVGTLEPRKNLETLVEAYHHLVRERGVAESLVLVGKFGWDFEPLLERIRDLGLDDRVHLPGHVRQDLMAPLMCGARLFIYPSLAEGFGFPPLEAMACGVPTIASHTTSLAENLEGAAELVSPRNTDALAAAMAKLLDDEQLRDRLRRQGLERAKAFRWEQTALATLACYKELYALDGSL